MAVPYTFGSATTSIPLSQLDSNFATTITLGNTAVQLGNTITTLTGVTNLASSGALTLGSNGNTTAVYVDTSQNVGIGNTSPAQKLDVTGSIKTSGQVFIGNNNYVGFANAAGTAAQSSIFNDTSNNLTFYNASASADIFYTNATERMRINAGAPILCLAGGSTSATGTGIAFPATQSASSDANTLDDYEEGTWSPTLKGDNAATGQTYSNQYGYYVKIGKLVYVTYDVTLTAKGTISGNITVSSLPFTCGGYNAGNAAGSVVYWQNMTTNWYSITCHLGQGVNYAQSFGTSLSTTTATTATSTTDLANNTRWMGMLVYPANA